MGRKIAFVVALLFASSIYGSDVVVPEQKIVGAEESIPLGELVTLSVTKPKAVPNLTATSYLWRVYDGYTEKKFAVDSEGNVFFGSGLRPKKLLALLSVTHVYVLKDGEKEPRVATKNILLSAIVNIGGGDPVPPPPDNPPQPLPDLPPGKNGLSRFVYDESKSVPADKRVKGAKALAGSFTSMASAIVAGAVVTPQDILKQTKAANDSALGSDAADWEKFSESLQEKLWALYKDKKLATANDFADAWKEIAVGLNAIK